MPLRILIAEEHEECCQLFKMFLQRYGYEVTAVNDRVRCLDEISLTDSYDVLILSWELPSRAGEEILEWIESHGIDHLAVIVLTAGMSLDEMSAELERFSITWIQRPFCLNELLDALEGRNAIAARSERCLEALIRRSGRPLNGVVFDDAATTQDPPDDRHSRRSRGLLEIQSTSAVCRERFDPSSNERALTPGTFDKSSRTIHSA